MWVWPQVPLEGPPLHPPLHPRTPPPTPDWAAPSRSIAKRAKGGWGEEGRSRRGGKGFGLREGSSNCNGGWGGDPPNTSWGQTHIWGLPKRTVPTVPVSGIKSGGVAAHACGSFRCGDPLSSVRVVALLGIASHGPIPV